MTNSFKNLSNLISEFRNLQDKDSVTPESLGFILQQLLFAIESYALMNNFTAEICANDLDSLGTDGSPAALEDFAYYVKRSRFSVTRDNFVVGVLDVFSDASCCAINQIFATTEYLVDGGFNGSHTDGVVKFYHRYFTLRENKTLYGKWSNWSEISLSKAILEPNPVVPNL